MASSLLVPTAILGRGLLALIFVLSPLVNLIPNFSSTVSTMGQAGVPLPSLALAVAIVISLIGAALLILGFHARIGALLLIAFLLPATYFFHAPWTASPGNVGEQTVHFLKNLGLLGAMLLVVVVGPGPGSIDQRRPGEK
jgi:putative oxidoreductase